MKKTDAQQLVSTYGFEPEQFPEMINALADVLEKMSVEATRNKQHEKATEYADAAKHLERAYHELL